MKKLALGYFIGMIISITSVLISSCGPTYVQQPPPVNAQYVPSNQNYDVIVDPVSGQQQVVYSMNGLQYVIAYATFMSWYNYGGYGYVNSMYGSNRNYFNSYNSNSYRSWKRSSFRDTYRGPTRSYSPKVTTSRQYNNSNNTYQKPISNSTSAFGTRTPNTYTRQNTSAFGRSTSNSSRSSFGSRKH